MTKRLFSAILTVTLSTLLVGMIILIAILMPYFEQQLATELTTELGYLSRGVSQYGEDFLSTIDPGSSRITLIDADGTVLYDSSLDASTLENHADREEVKQALATGSGESVRYSTTLQEKTLYRALLLPSGDVLRIACTHYSSMGIFLLLIQPILLILTFGAVLSAVISYKVSHRLTRPLNEIDLEHPQVPEDYEELTPLLRRLNHQNRQIKAQLMELGEQQERFASITENMKEGFLVLDRTGTVLSHNTSAGQLLHAEAPLMGRDMTHSPIEELNSAIRDALEGQHTETLIPLFGRMCQLFANPVYQQDQLTGTVIVLLDVTEKQERETLRREFSANVSHELKTPLTSISGIAEIMKSGLIDPNDVPHFAGKIYDESQRLIHLVGDIIKLSQLDENSIPYTAAPVDLLELAQNTRIQLENPAAKQQVTLQVEGEPVVIEGVLPVLDEMLFNLCDNAIKYNKPGGHVWVSVKHTPDGPTLTVKDDGIGIPTEDHERVFERFYRVDKSHSKAIGGTGLGLSIVKHSAAYHNARIELESAPGKGTCIRLIFPPGREIHGQEQAD